MSARLAAILELKCSENIPLSRLTRFAIGGPARILADASSEAALMATLDVVRGTPHALIGGGSNLVADDRGFPGVVLRYTAKNIGIDGPWSGWRREPCCKTWWMPLSQPDRKDCTP